MYDTKDEFNQKLSNCVVLFKGSPYQILEASGSSKPKITLLAQNMREKKSETISAWEDGWDFRTLGSRLGYVNVDFGEGSYRQSLYTYRMAIRQASNTQGLSQRNVKYDALRGDTNRNLAGTKLSWGQLVSVPGFLDTLERKFPTIHQVSQNFLKEKDLTSQAFDPKFAVSRRAVGPYFLEYRGKEVGYSEDFYRWKLGDDFDYLRESLEHINLRVA